MHSRIVCPNHISSYMLGFKNYLAEMIIRTRQCVAYKNMSLGQRSRSQLALKVCAFQIHVRPITSSCMVELKNYLEEIIITTRHCVACKNHAARSKVKVTAVTLSLCILESCPTHNFIPTRIRPKAMSGLGRNMCQ